MARGSGREASASPKMIPVAPEQRAHRQIDAADQDDEVWPIATIPVITD